MASINLDFANRIMPQLASYHKICLNACATVSLAATKFDVFSGLGFASLYKVWEYFNSSDFIWCLLAVCLILRRKLKPLTFQSRIRVLKSTASRVLESCHSSWRTLRYTCWNFRRLVYSPDFQAGHTCHANVCFNEGLVLEINNRRIV